MKVIRNTNYLYEGVSDTLLKFRDIRYNDEFLLVKRCKFIDVSQNIVYYMQCVGGKCISNPKLPDSNNSAGLTHTVG